MYDVFKSFGLFMGSVFLMLIYKRNVISGSGKNEKLKEPVVRREKGKINQLEEESKLFALLFDSGNSTSNRNISTELYNYETYEKMNEESEEEFVWKRRSLMQTTQNGNIVMYYDLYRQAFAYHSDSYISYPILNQCAMKYVRLFFCRDFFVDTTVLPKSFVNPFNQMKEMEEIRQKQQATTKRQELKINFDSSAFVKKPKLKPKKVTYKEDLLLTEKNIVKNDVIIYKNNFRWIGKISGNWRVLQPVPRRQQISSTPIINDDYDHIPIHQEHAKNSYSLWKLMMKS